MTDLCVTGGLGVVGSLIAKSQIAKGKSVWVVDDGTEPRHRLNKPNCGLFANRLGGFQPVGAFNAKRILHAAASTGIPYSGTAPQDDWSRNVDGTIAVLEALRLEPRPMVALSSVKPYRTDGLSVLEREDHCALSGDGIDESVELLPDEVYASSKAAQSMVCRAYARTYDLPVVVFRCSNLMGPACPKGPAHGVATWLAIQAALGWEIEIQGDGRQSRDFLFWSDVESASMEAFAMLESGDIEPGTIFNLGGGRGNVLSVLQIVELLRSFGAKFSVRSGPGRKNEDRLFVTDTRKFHVATGWKPEVSARDGVRQIYEWARDNADALARVYGEWAP